MRNTTRGRGGWARVVGGDGRLGVHVTMLLLALCLARPALAQLGPLANGGFETGDLSRWTTDCFGASGGCDNWSVTVAPGYAARGGFGARLFNAHVGWYGHAELWSEVFDDTSATYTLPMRLVGGARKFYCGVIVHIAESGTGREVQYIGNTLGSAFSFPTSNPYACGLFRMVPGQWAEYTFDFQGDFFRLHGRLPNSRRYIIIDAYQDDDFVELDVDDLLVPRTQQSPIAVTGLTLSKKSVSSAEVLIGEVTLNAPAPAGGAVVTITSRNQAAPAPPPVFIPAGETRGTFAIQATYAPTTRPGWITAIYGRGAVSADLTVLPVPVTALVLQQSAVTGGVSVAGAVQFATPAAPESIDVTLSSSDPAVAAVPGHAGFSESAGTAEFTVATSAVTAPTTVYITAASPAGTAMTRLEVLPPSPGQPPVLGAITASPGWLTGGGVVTATVTLTAPAPAGGAVVALSSSRGGTLAPPASVTVPAGATAATFPVATLGVATGEEVTLSAAYAGQTRTVMVHLEPPALAALTLDLTALLAGQSTTATVTLNGPAPVGGASIVLSSSNTSAAVVPAAVAVPEGATTATFPVLTAPAFNWTSSSIVGTINARSKGATLTIGTTNALVLSVKETSILGGTPTLGVLTLVGATLTAPLEIILSSADTTTLLVPARVTFPTGQRVLTFPVATQPVAASRRIAITAAWGSVSTPVDLVITAPQLASLNLTPAALLGGGFGTGTVAITGPAPLGGTVVTITGSNDALASPPASVTVPPGALTASFPVATRAVTTPNVVTLIAGLNGQLRYGTLVLTGALVSALALDPGSVTGGAPAQGAVTLAQPAPPGGVVIALTSANAAAAVPASVTVPAGASAATFTITTQSVTSSTTALITASYAGLSQATATLAVLPAGLASLGLAATSTTGGGTVKAALALRGPAPPGGAVVTLSTANPSLIRVPATVTVPPGATTAVFDVTTQPVSVATVATIAAAYAGETQTAALTLLPVVVSALSLPTTTTPGGEMTTATLTLSGPSPPGGAIVTLASSDPSAASVPATVTVPEGATTATIPVETSSVATLTRVVITASYGGVTRSATLTVASVKLAWFRLGLGSVTGGTGVIGAVMLSELAPPGGVTVKLSSDRPEVAEGPEHVLVPEGTGVSFFLVTTSQVQSATALKLSATFGGVTQEIVLQVLPPGGDGGVGR